MAHSGSNLGLGHRQRRKSMNGKTGRTRGKPAVDGAGIEGRRARNWRDNALFSESGMGGLWGTRVRENKGIYIAQTATIAWLEYGVRAAQFLD